MESNKFLTIHTCNTLNTSFFTILHVHTCNGHDRPEQIESFIYMKQQLYHTLWYLLHAIKMYFLIGVVCRYSCLS